MKKVHVYLSLSGTNVLLGNLFIDVVRGKESYSFEFSPSALEKGYGNLLCDNELFPIPGRQYKADSSSPYHFMMDSSPDRWGRKLLQKAASGKTLFESDYLLGISDVSRMGALRFSLSEDGPFLSESEDIPPYRYLRELETAAYSFDEYSEDPRWKALLSPGSSLGGARPKATVYGNDGELYLAKFSHKNDAENLPAMEYWTYLLAISCSIDMMPSSLVRLDFSRSVFLTKRFDRNGKRRIHYVSFMTLFGAKEGDSSSYCYLDLAKRISESSHQPKRDLVQLYRRIAFSLLVHNYDDHLRNHAMIWGGDGRWSLSPAFDLNMTLDKAGLSLSVSEKGSDLPSLIEAAPYFSLSRQEGEQIVIAMKRTLRESFLPFAKKASIPEAKAEGIKKYLPELFA